jgi:hypothetical protein
MTDIKYVAFDVHKSAISIAVINLDGKLVTQAAIQTDANAVRDFLRGLSGQVYLTYEEGTHSQWMYELTRSLVAKLTVCNARHSSSSGNKSDKFAALRLAELLRAGMLKAVYHGLASTQTLKQLVHYYDSLTEETTRVRNRIKAVFRSRAVACSGRDIYTRNRCEWIEKLKEEGLRLKGGKYKRPCASLFKDGSIVVLDPHDGRYNSEIIHISFQNGRIKSTAYYPD